jgi:hypothetical protein
MSGTGLESITFDEQKKPIVSWNKLRNESVNCISLSLFYIMCYYTVHLI